MHETVRMPCVTRVVYMVLRSSAHSTSPVALVDLPLLPPHSPVAQDVDSDAVLNLKRLAKKDPTTKVRIIE